MMYRGGRAGGAAAAALNDSHSNGANTVQVVPNPRTEAEKREDQVKVLQFGVFVIAIFIVMAMIVLVGNAIEQYHDAKKGNK